MVMSQNIKPAAAHGIYKKTDYSKPWTGHAAHKRALPPDDLTAHKLTAGGKHHALSSFYCASTAVSISGPNKTSTQAVLSPALRQRPEKGILMMYRGPTCSPGLIYQYGLRRDYFPCKAMQSNATRTHAPQAADRGRTYQNTA